MGVQHTTVHRRRDVKVSTKDHPFVRVDFTEAVSTDVVRFGILRPCHQRIICEPLRDDFQSKTFQVSNEILCSIFVGCISLSGPSVQVAHGTVSCIREIGRLIGHVADVIEHIQTINEPG